MDDITTWERAMRAELARLDCLASPERQDHPDNLCLDTLWDALWQLPLAPPLCARRRPGVRPGDAPRANAAPRGGLTHA
jgi:hypothetical protein